MALFHYFYENKKVGNFTTASMKYSASFPEAIQYVAAGLPLIALDFQVFSRKLNLMS
jgi:hypothetical protein